MIIKGLVEDEVKNLEHFGIFFNMINKDPETMLTDIEITFGDIIVRAHDKSLRIRQSDHQYFMLKRDYVSIEV